MKAPKKRSKYKSVDHWLEAVYRKNRDEIDTALADVKNKRSSFINLVKGYMEEGLRPEKALGKLINSTIFTPEAVRFKQNVLEAIKSHGKFKEFRNLIKDARGKFAKVELSKFSYDKKNKVYYYYTDAGNIVIINFTNSPEDIILEML